MSEKPKVFGHLFAEVVKKGLCSLCGACIASCDEGVIDIRDEEPAITGKCIACGICHYQCPAKNPPSPELEERIFGKERGTEDEAELGVFRAIYSAKARDGDVHKVAQDGGVVTALLACTFRENLADAAVVVGVERDKPWMPKPMVATVYQDLLKTSGTKYVSAPVLLGLREAVVNYLKREVALVGTPCQIRALRNMQHSPRGYLKLGGAVIFAIGLFCWESFSYKLVSDYLQKQKGIDPAGVKKFSIEAGRFRLFREGKLIFEEAVKNLKGYARGACHTCQDFTSEYADISVGHVGSSAGWSTVIVRSEAGERLFRVACEKGFLEHRPLEKEMIDKLLKTARSKRASVTTPEAGI